MPGLSEIGSKTRGLELESGIALPNGPCQIGWQENGVRLSLEWRGGERLASRLPTPAAMSFAGKHTNGLHCKIPLGPSSFDASVPIRASQARA
jgi:hypothetical protein